MTNPKVQNEIGIIEITGKDFKIGQGKILKISSHVTHNERVVLEIDDNKYTIKASHLNLAIENATNVSLT